MSDMLVAAATPLAETARSFESSDVDRAGLAVLAAGYTHRPARPLGVWDLAGQIVKAYTITAPVETWARP